jgi:hypothetical protein
VEPGATVDVETDDATVARTRGRAETTEKNTRAGRDATRAVTREDDVDGVWVWIRGERGADGVDDGARGTRARDE